MLYLPTRRSAEIVRPRVMPDDAQANALREKFAALNYTPENGFHKDRRQDRRSVAQAPARRWSHNVA
jgi:hypothetical protein